MPVGQTLSAAAQGAVFGRFPIRWIVVNPLWVNRMTVRTRHFDTLRRSLPRLSDDPRIQALVVAFCFGALLEALAGFVAPVALSPVMPVALGFAPVKAAVDALAANTAPVACGAVGTPVVTLAQVTELPLDTAASVVGRQTPLPAPVMPLVPVGSSTDGADCARPGSPPRLQNRLRGRPVRGVPPRVRPTRRHRRRTAGRAGALAAVPQARRPAAEPVRAAVLTLIVVGQSTVLARMLP